MSNMIRSYQRTEQKHTVHKREETHLQKREFDQSACSVLTETKGGKIFKRNLNWLLNYTTQKANRVTFLYLYIMGYRLLDSLIFQLHPK